ncbi:BZ3500_MvSof-1268-A1-R1_Chr10-2g02989 [Microbotryum saponariae]|uniref:BZ3500_MvSof-1268-A1-R1_Chr10-2g02989 protein n=1 Tax=Microbotryum saponariae TaxID=289078 RepID=A0A2X0LRM4_9BASI|nr:BZ3501_MvSof-1269-A2-R1_Chr10-2g02575 [Microbotryum saponariae]SDA01883.1 BZ3500_MvSof-1268-A1-R1_Chr10-2g02989 [Microbotryum saponariae]
MSALVEYASSSAASSDHEEEMQQVSVEVDEPASAQPPVHPAAPADAPLEQAAPAPPSAPPVVASEPPQAEQDSKDDQDEDQDEDEDEDDDDDDDDDDMTPEPDYSFASPPPPPLDTNGHGHAEDVDQEHEPPQDNNHDYEEQGEEPTKLKAATRIHELDIVQQDIAKLLHLAGCTLASLDPEPNPNLAPSNEKPTTIPEDKKERFDHFAQAYFTTLNVRLSFPLQDIQLSLRTSIRHLALSKPSLQALLDPNYASLLPTQALEPGQSSIAAGGIAHRCRIDPLPLTKSIPKWTTRDAHATSAARVEEDGSMRLSVAARALQAEAWRDLARIASAGQDRMKE